MGDDPVTTFAWEFVNIALATLKLVTGWTVGAVKQGEGRVVASRRNNFHAFQTNSQIGHTCVRPQKLRWPRARAL